MERYVVFLKGYKTGCGITLEEWLELKEYFRVNKDNKISVDTTKPRQL